MDKKNYIITEICKKTNQCNLKKRFKDYFLNYYPDESNSWNFKYNINTLGKVKKNDFHYVFEKLQKYYNEVTYIKELKNIVNDLNDNIKDTILILKGFDYDKEFLVNNYLEYWENLNYVIIYGYEEKYNKLCRKIIGEYGDILLERHLELNKNEVKGIIYWGNINKQIYKTNDELNEFCNKIQLKKEDDKIKIRVYFYDRKIEKIKDDIDFMMKRLELELGQKDSKIMIFNGYNYDTSISFAGIVLNPSNFKYFNEVRWDRFMEMQKYSGKLMLIGIRNYLINNSDSIDMKRFLIFSSMILFLYGLRKPNDVDILGYDKPKIKNKVLNLFNNYGSCSRRILEIGELSVRGYGEWKAGLKKEYLNNWFGFEWPRMFGAKDMEDMIFNPRYYISLIGLKIISLNADIERRKIRYRAAAYSDLIAYNYFMPIKTKIDEPPYKYIVSGEEKNYESKEEILKLLKKIKEHLRNRYDIRMNIEYISKELGLPEKRTGFISKEILNKKNKYIVRRLGMYNRVSSRKKVRN